MELTHGERVDLDEKDKAIIEQLQLNARQTIAEIARKTKLPRDVVVYRIKKMEENRVIRAHHTFINPAKIGYPLYSYVMVTLNNINVEEEKKFISFLKANKHVVYIAKNSGKFDFTLGICSKDYMEFDMLLQEIRRKFSDAIKNYEITPVVQEYKYDWMADLI